MIENKFDELSEVDTKSLSLWLQYIGHYLKYLITFFFFHAPIKEYHTCFISSHRVAWDITRFNIATKNEKDIYVKNAFIHRVNNFLKEKLNGD